MTDRELELDTPLPSSEKLLEDLIDAVDLASDQDQATWLTSDGKRIAAIVPVDMAEYADVTKHLWRNERVIPAREVSLLGRLDRKLVKEPLTCPEPGREQA